MPESLASGGGCPEGEIRLYYEAVDYTPCTSAAQKKWSVIHVTPPGHERPLSLSITFWTSYAEKVRVGSIIPGATMLPSPGRIPGATAFYLGDPAGLSDVVAFQRGGIAVRVFSSPNTLRYQEVRLHPTAADTM